jgi:hypothetical protein|tara:strand:- start:35 stop:316 length:282 start_codon:yes stop_codon:yes gene_type:complete
MEELLKAVKRIKGILRKSEEEGDNFQEVIGKLSDVKIHGVQLPTMMLMEITDDFVKGYQDRRKSEAMKGFDEGELQEKFRAASYNWNNKDTIN